MKGGGLMQHLLWKVMVYTVFSLIILASDTPLFIKVIFLSVMVFFLLPYVDAFLTTERLLRKCVAAFSGAVLMTGLIVLVSTPLETAVFDAAYMWEFGLVFSTVLFYACLGFFIYGIPLSILSDMVATRFSFRLAMAGAVHLLGGLLLVPMLSVLPLMAMLIFWLLDEALQRRKKADSTIDLRES